MAKEPKTDGGRQVPSPPLATGRRNMRGKWIMRLGTLLVSGLASLLLCEGALRMAQSRPSRRTFCVWPPRMRHVFAPRSDIVVGVSGASRFLVNSNGIRGDEPSPADRLRILAIGGSTTECLLLDQTEAWPHLLQAALRQNDLPVWVGNVGRSGATTRHHVTAMRYLPLEELKIDMVLLLIGFNDMSVRLARDTQYDPFFMDRPRAEAELMAETFQGSFRPHPGQPWFKRTAIWQAIRRLRVLRQGAYVQDNAGSVLNVWRSHRQGAAEYRDRLPDLDAGLAEFATNVRRLVDLGRERGVRTVFMTQPCLWRADLTPAEEALLWFGGIGDFQRVAHQPYYSVPALMNAMARYNACLKDVCRERAVPCLDLAALIPSDTTAFYDDVHFNEGGATLAAQDVARFLLANGLLGPERGDRWKRTPKSVASSRDYPRPEGVSHGERAEN